VTNELSQLSALGQAVTGSWKEVEVRAEWKNWILNIEKGAFNNKTAVFIENVFLFNVVLRKSSSKYNYPSKFNIP
jgi:hypothetical protein